MTTARTSEVVDLERLNQKFITILNFIYRHHSAYSERERRTTRKMYRQTLAELGRATKANDLSLQLRSDILRHCEKMEINPPKWVK